MKIVSSDNKFWVELVKVEDEYGYSAFSIYGYADLGHSKFEAKNNDVHLLNLPEFISKFDRFILDRTLVPKLEGTYDSYLEFKCVGSPVILTYNIGSAYCGTTNSEFGFTGSFEVEQEYLNTLLLELQENA
ncbi:hypothetical protein [Saccharophagus degradans]|uniref:Uncharacterized protein n=1 Tax=Saccharophagus degradans (strain 2-40 / ATCC 43961 / DSM 17024) TaxID=203122 RepID=Q21I87_SACD2|nr:hypothetical protein [Saccharophagus degradans]ABD81592.1 hypothetical protein Sde_2332 [Saccharophagus degradans 2-40]